MNVREWCHEQGFVESAAIVACEKLYKLLEEKFTPANSDYAAALRVRNEYVDTHSIKGADINGFADYCEQRLNSAEPNCA